MSAPENVSLDSRTQWGKEFEFNRGALFALAYRMLGATQEAEDIVQDAWLRVCERTFDDVQRPRSFLFTVVSRLALDRIKSGQKRREEYVGTWLPEPMSTKVGAPGFARSGPDAMCEAESISHAFLIVMQRLNPVERAAFLLHRVFDFSHGETAALLDKSEPTIRKAFSRAQARVQTGGPRFAPTSEAHAAILGAFGAAVASGDLVSLQTLLSADVRAASDGGGHASAALNVIRGRDTVIKFFVGVFKKRDPSERFEVAEVNGWPAVVMWTGAAVTACLQIETDGQQIFGVHNVRNPHKLKALEKSLATRVAVEIG